MTSVPVNARSEFVTPAKCSGAGVCEIIRRFQIASPASWRPALRPTRGSGDGAMMIGADMSGPAIGPPAWVELPLVARAQAATVRARRRVFIRMGRVGEVSLLGIQRGQHLLHPIDLRRLIGLDIVRELEHDLVRGGRLGEQV